MFTRRNVSALIAALAIISMLIMVAPAFAIRKAAGPGCANGPDDAINNAEAGDIFTPLYEQDFGRNTNGAVIKVNMEIEGGWSAPNFDCGGNSTGVFQSREDMLAAGLLYNPANLSGLKGFDSPVVSIDEGVKSVAIRNINFLRGQEMTGDGGGFKLVGNTSSPRLSGATITIDNSAFRADFFSDPVGVTGDGGGLLLDLDANSRLTIKDSTFKDLVAGGKGGGFAITVRGGSQVTIQNTLVQGNRANTCGGGIITIYGGTVTLSDNTFENNGSDGATPDLCVVRPQGSTGPATLYLLNNQFSQGGVSIDAGITVLNSLPTNTPTSTATRAPTNTPTRTPTTTPKPILTPREYLPLLQR